MTPASFQAVAEGRKRQVKRDAKEVDQLVGKLYAEGALLRDIVTETGLGIDGVRGSLKRLGIKGVDNRTRRAKTAKGGSELASSAANAREGLKRAGQERRARLVEEFTQLGGDQAAVVELGRRHNMTPGAMRGRLVKIGALPRRKDT
ncbi:hypothetical protein ACFWNF_15700 [Streptomyces anulatus]|uniref:hypothetical protein n=1 Tax=Streptomyces anulatus TaxID=1892 RepID=UPI00365FF809